MLQFAEQVLAICAAAMVLPTATEAAQSSASTYSYGTYNPVQAAINRDTMNAAILRQATGGRGRRGTRPTVHRRAHHR